MRQIATGAGRRRGAALAVAGSAGRNGAPMVDALPRRQRPESSCHRPVRKCRRLLAGELGVEPGTTTQALVEQIRQLPDGRQQHTRTAGHRH